MSKLEQLFVLEQVLEFTLIYGFSGGSVWEVHTEVQVAEEEGAVVIHCTRQRLGLAKGRLDDSLDHLCASVYLSTA